MKQTKSFIPHTAPCTFSHGLFRMPLVALMLLALCACNNNKFHVNGTITEAKDSTLYFEHMSLDGAVAIDSIKLDEKGDFSFSEEAGEAPEFYRLRIAGSIINVSVDSTETVTFKAKYPTMATQYEVTGSDNCEKIKQLSILQIQLLNRAIAINVAPDLGVKQAADSIKVLMEQYKDHVRANYIFKEPQKAYSYFALFQTLGPSTIFNPRESELDIRSFAAVATAWDTYYPGAKRGENLHNIAIEGLKVLRANKIRNNGPEIDMDKVEVTNIIDVPLTDNKGVKRSLKQLAGKVVLLDFHAFSMKGSTERIMMLRELYNKYHNAGLEIYQVGIDADEHFWKTQTAALPWICVYDPDGVESSNLSRYNVQTIPTFFLIDRSNSLYKRDAQIENLDKEISSLL